MIKMKWEEIIKRHCGCGQKVCKTYGKIQKGKGERHFYIERGKPVQWVGPTHKHPDGTLMSGKEHTDKSKILYHLYDLKEKHLKHLSKDTTVIKLSPKQRKIAELKPPKDKIDADDLAELRRENA